MRNSNGVRLLALWAHQVYHLPAMATCDAGFYLMATALGGVAIPPSRTIGADTTMNS